MPVKGRVVISEMYCKGCELCVGACPQGSLALAADRITAKGYHPAVLIDNHCTGCAICAVVCPEAAIQVFREMKRSANSDQRSAREESDQVTAFSSSLKLKADR